MVRSTRCRGSRFWGLEAETTAGAQLFGRTTIHRTSRYSEATRGRLRCMLGKMGFDDFSCLEGRK